MIDRFAIEQVEQNKREKYEQMELICGYCSNACKQPGTLLSGSKTQTKKVMCGDFIMLNMMSRILF